MLLVGLVCNFARCSSPYCLGNPLVQCCWKVLCAIHMLFVPLLLGEPCSNMLDFSCVQFAYCLSPFCLGIPWSKYHWKNLCVRFTHCSSPIIWGISWSNTVGMSCALFTCCSSLIIQGILVLIPFLAGMACCIPCF